MVSFVQPDSLHYNRQVPGKILTFALQGSFLRSLEPIVRSSNSRTHISDFNILLPINDQHIYHI